MQTLAGSEVEARMEQFKNEEHFMEKREEEEAKDTTRPDAEEEQKRAEGVESLVPGKPAAWEIQQH